MRLGTLAKELEIKPRDILDFLKKEKDLELELNLNLKIEEDWEEALKNHFKPEEKIEVVETQVEITEEIVAINTENSEETAKEVLIDGEEETEETSIEIETPHKPVEITGEVPKGVIENAPLVERERIVLEGPKILAKIELPEKPKPKEEEQKPEDAENEGNEPNESTEKPARKKNIKNKRITLTEEERFARYEKRMEENKKREEKAKNRQKARAKKVVAEKRKEHYLKQLKSTTQAKPKHKVKKEKQKAKENVSPMLVSEIEKREKERRAHNKSWFGRMMQKIFGI